jgi:hypothetical protein
MIAVASGILLAIFTICLVIGLALIIRSIVRSISRRAMAYNISNVRGLPPSDAKRWMGVVMMFLVVIGLGYIVNKSTQHDVPIKYSEESNGGTVVASHGGMSLPTASLRGAPNFSH